MSEQHGTMISRALQWQFGGRATAHLEAAAIATMCTAPTEIVPAPGPGKVIVVTGGIVEYVGGCLWDVTQQPRVFYGGNDLTDDEDQGDGISASCLFSVINEQAEAHLFQTLVASADDGTHPDPAANIINRSLVVGVTGTDPTPFEAEPSGDLYVTVFYTVVDVAI